VHLVGFIIRIYHAQSYECQNLKMMFVVVVTVTAVVVVVMAAAVIVTALAGIQR